jgi:hypothetical protein
VSAVPITPFVAEGAFSPEAVQALAAVLRAVCQELGLKDGSDPAQVVAETIIQLASTGDYDERGLQAAVLKAFRHGRSSSANAADGWYRSPASR